jgi:zinc and cadmium transporter
MDKVILSLIGGFLVSVVSFAGMFILLIKTEKLRGITHYLISLAVGVLLGDAFLHLIPDSIERTGNFNNVLLFTLVGILLFFFLEKVVRWNHNHSLPDLKEVGLGEEHIAKMNLVGDALHNFIDGTLIAGSFLVDVKLGITTTLAIIIHEIPQEIGDIGTLIYSGYSPKKAVWLNFLCSLSCLAGVIAVLVMEI